MANKRYNGAQRGRNEYEPMLGETVRLLDALFCGPNQALAQLLRALNKATHQTGGHQGQTIEPEHGYACVTGW